MRPHIVSKKEVDSVLEAQGFIVSSGFIENYVVGEFLSEKLLVIEPQKSWSKDAHKAQRTCYIGFCPDLRHRR